jgi:AhpD family alkylhydroperoxidase
MTNHLYDKENLSKLKELAPEQLQAFSEFNTAVMKEGALSKKEKEIIAVVIAHVTECPYCIDSHTRRAKAEGVFLEELVEADFVVAGGVVTHSIIYIMHWTQKQIIPFIGD